MQKLAIILFMLLYCSGTMLLPMGNFSCTKSISEMYADCKEEDPDINPLDFVVEHLLNLGNVIEHFEKGTDEENEKPHAPFQQLQSISQTLVVVGSELRFEVKYIPLPESRKITYPICPDDFIRSDYLSKIFRPPSV